MESNFKKVPIKAIFPGNNPLHPKIIECYGLYEISGDKLNFHGFAFDKDISSDDIFYVIDFYNKGQVKIDILGIED